MSDRNERHVAALFHVRGSVGRHQERHRHWRRPDGLGYRTGVRTDRPQRHHRGAQSKRVGQDPAEHREQRAAGGQEGVQRATGRRRKVRGRHAVPVEHVHQPDGRGARRRPGARGDRRESGRQARSVPHRGRRRPGQNHTRFEHVVAVHRRDRLRYRETRPVRRPAFLQSGARHAAAGSGQDARNVRRHIPDVNGLGQGHRQDGHHV